MPSGSCLLLEATCPVRLCSSPCLKQERAILSLLELREDIGLPEPRITVPAMADISRRHAQLNLLNLEVVAAARY